MTLIEEIDLAVGKYLELLSQDKTSDADTLKRELAEKYAIVVKGSGPHKRLDAPYDYCVATWEDAGNPALSEHSHIQRIVTYTFVPEELIQE